MSKVLIFFVLVLSATKLLAAVPVEVASAKYELFSQKIEALGTLRANEAVTLSSSVTEIVTAINFRDGQDVRANSVLVEMTSGEEKAQLEGAKSDFEEAKRQYDRVKSLEADHLAAISDLDERKRALETAESRLQVTRSRLRDRLIIAPFSGVVGLRNLSVGTLVKPGDSIVTLDDVDTMKLDISLPSTHLAVMKIGTKIQAKASALVGEEFLGEVSSIDTRIDPITRSIIVRAILPNQERKLIPGMLMTVSLTSPEQQKLLIPEESIVQEGFRKFVFVVKQSEEKNIVRKQQIFTGARYSGRVVVDSGLQEGDSIVVHGIMRLRDKSEIKIMPPKFSLDDAANENAS